MTDTIRRKLYFYRVHIGTQESGEPIPFNAPSIFRALRQANLIANGCAYISLPQTEDVLRCAVDDIENGQVRLRIGKIRRENLPKQEHNGTVTDLQLPVEAGLLEEAHIVFFENNIVGMEFNYYAPRINGLKSVVTELLPQYTFEDFQFRQLISEDVLARLNELGELTLFQLRVAPSFASQIQHLDSSLADAITAAANAGSTEEVEIILRRPARSRTEFLAQSLKSFCRAVVQSSEFYNNAKKFKISAQNPTTNKVESLDLLKDKLIVERDIAKSNSRSRAVISNEAYNAISMAHSEMYELLINAPAIGDTLDGATTHSA